MYDPVGFSYDADVHCVQCAERRFGVGVPDGSLDSEGNEPGAIFADSESDTPEHCGDCRAFLGTNLTADGYAYVVESLAQASGNPDVLAEWFDAYAEWFDADQWKDLAESWFPTVLRVGPLIHRHITVKRGSVRLDTGTLDYARDDSPYSARDYPSVTFVFDMPTDADSAYRYRPFRKEG